MPRVSVLMPVFNSARYLPQALLSIRDQSFRDYELIVIDDGSTDNSLDLLRAFASEEPRMRVIARANKGIVATRNELLSEANGDFIAWMDSDDVSHEARLSRLLAAFDKDGELVCLGTDVQLIDPDGFALGYERYPTQHEDIRSEQRAGSGFRFPSTMQRRSVADTVGGFRAPFPMGEDLDYLLRVGEHGRLGNLPEALYVYRQHLGNTCTTHGMLWPHYRQIILDLAAERQAGGSDALQRGDEVPAPSTEARASGQFESVVLLGWADGALEAGHRMRAMRYILKALVRSPTYWSAWRRLAKSLLRRGC